MAGIRARLVLIEWVDSLGCSTQWQKLDSISTDPLRCRSVGWLIHDGRESKVIVPHVYDDEHPSAPVQGCGDMVIPAKSVIGISDLFTKKLTDKDKTLLMLR
jgi:hypothetical protein